MYKIATLMQSILLQLSLRHHLPHPLPPIHVSLSCSPEWLSPSLSLHVSDCLQLHVMSVIKHQQILSFATSTLPDCRDCYQLVLLHFEPLCFLQIVIVIQPVTCILTPVSPPMLPLIWSSPAVLPLALLLCSGA